MLQLQRWRLFPICRNWHNDQVEIKGSRAAIISGSYRTPIRFCFTQSLSIDLDSNVTTLAAGLKRRATKMQSRAQWSNLSEDNFSRQCWPKKWHHSRTQTVIGEGFPCWRSWEYELAFLLQGGTTEYFIPSNYKLQLWRNLLQFPVQNPSAVPVLLVQQTETQTSKQ